MQKTDTQKILEAIGGLQKTVDGHTKILNDHTKILDGHSAVLIGHTKRFDDLEKMIKEDVLDAISLLAEQMEDFRGEVAAEFKVIKSDIRVLDGKMERLVGTLTRKPALTPMEAKMIMGSRA